MHKIITNILSSVSSEEDSGKRDILNHMVLSIIQMEIPPAIEYIAANWREAGGVSCNTSVRGYSGVKLTLNMKVNPENYSIFIETSHIFNEIFEKNMVNIKIRHFQREVNIKLLINDVTAKHVYNLIYENIKNITNTK